MRLFRKRSSNNSNFSHVPSKVGSEVVRALGMGIVLLTSIWLDVLSDVLVIFGRSFAGDWLCERFLFFCWCE